MMSSNNVKTRFNFKENVTRGDNIAVLKDVIDDSFYGGLFQQPASKYGRASTLRLLAFLFDDYNGCNYQHPFNQDTIAISSKLKRQIIGHTHSKASSAGKDCAFNQIFTKVFKGNSYQKQCDGYILTEKAKVHYNKIIQNTTFEYSLYSMSRDEIFYTGKNIDEVCPVVVQEGVTMRRNIKIDMDYMPEHFNENQKYAIRNIRNKANENNEIEGIYFGEKDSDERRYYMRGSNNIQGLQKYLRNVLLNGQHDYDIESAATSILPQFYDKNFKRVKGLVKSDLRFIKFVNENKDKIRNWAASYFFKGVKEAKKYAKKLLSAIMFGANVLKISCSFYTELKNELKWSDMEIMELHRKIIKSEFIKGYRSNYRSMNRFSKRFNHGKLHELYRSLERQVIDSVMEYCDGNDNPVQLVIHDGFTTLKPVDMVAMLAHIKQSTGFDLKFSYEIISANETEAAA